MASNLTSPPTMLPVQQAIWAPARSPIDAIWPIALYLPFVTTLPKYFLKRGLPTNYTMSQRMLILHIALCAFEAARFHSASLRYNAASLIGPQFALDAPPLPTVLDVGIVVLNVAIALRLARVMRIGNPKIVRPAFQAVAVTQLVATLLAYGLVLHANSALLDIDSQAQGQVTTELYWAARLHRASSRALDGFPITRGMLLCVKAMEWVGTAKEVQNWGNFMGFVVAVNACDLPGLVPLFFGAMFAVGALQDWVGRVVRRR
jgi:hypothetical protein